MASLAREDAGSAGPMGERFGVDLLIVLAGQSNMAGRGDVRDPAYTALLAESGRGRCFLFREGSWSARPCEPLHDDTPPP